MGELPQGYVPQEERPMQPEEGSLHVEEPSSPLWRTLLLESLPPDERVAILGLMLLLCVSLTGGAFLGSMLISVIVFAR